jgi:hypothetical protein
MDTKAEFLAKIEQIKQQLAKQQQQLVSVCKIYNQHPAS